MKRKDVFSLIGVLAVAVLFGAALSLARCNSPTTPDPIVSYEFCEVDKIININTKGVAGVPFDLNTAVVKPVGATHKDVVWTVRGDDDGAVGITTENIIGGKFTPQNTGELKLLATIADGLGAGFPYTQTVNLTFIDEADYVSTSGITGVRTKAVAGVLANLATDKVVVMPNDSYFATYTAIEWTIKDAGTTGAKIVNKSILKTKAAGTVIVTANVAYGRSITEGASAAERDWVQDFEIEVLSTAPGEEDSVYDGVDNEWTGVQVTSLTLNHTNETMTTGSTLQLAATTVPAGVPVKWLSSKPSAFSVSADGLVTANGSGTAIIRAKAGSKIAECTVAVQKAAGLYQGEDAKGVTGLAASFEWIKNNGANDGGEYTIVLGANEEDTTAGYSIGTTDRVDGTNSSTGAKKNLTITLQGTNSAITIEKKAEGALFTIYGFNADDVPHLILENITLKGFNSNNKALVVVGHTQDGRSGKLTMKTGSRITENVNSAATGGGVCVVANSTFVMNDGRIDNNRSKVGAGHGGGVINAGTFKMINGSIDHNIVGADTGTSASRGGGVYSGGNTSVFEMSGGTISENKCTPTDAASGNMWGGGVYAYNFTMTNGNITGNEARFGGGVAIQMECYFKMSGGVIAGNKAKIAGAGFFTYDQSKTIFSVKGGVIYGTNNPLDSTLANCGSTEDPVHAIELWVASGNSSGAIYCDVTVNKDVEVSFTKGTLVPSSGYWN